MSLDMQIHVPRPQARAQDYGWQDTAKHFAQGKNRSLGEGWGPRPSWQSQAHLAEAANQLRMQDQSLVWARAPSVPLGPRPGQATPPRPSGGHSLSLVPGDWLHLGVGQQVRAVAHLHVHHVLLGLHLHKLVGDPFDGLPAAPGKGREGFETTFPRSLGSSRSDKAVPNPWQTKPTWGPQSLIPQPQALEKILEAQHILSALLPNLMPILTPSSPVRPPHQPLHLHTCLGTATTAVF